MHNAFIFFGIDHIMQFVIRLAADRQTSLLEQAQN